jgi:hypothetical protein
LLNCKTAYLKVENIPQTTFWFSPATSYRFGAQFIDAGPNVLILFTVTCSTAE